MALNLDDLIEMGDIDELLREIDRRSDRRDWDGLMEVHDRCRLAVERGRQLWGVAANAAYRIALEAPGPYAASVVGEDVGPFALGPLPEVAASTHSWDELEDDLPAGPLEGITAYERTVRGEDLAGRPSLIGHLATFELPLALQSWEPVYPVAEYRSDVARFPMPELSPGEALDFRATSWTDVDEPDAVRALVEITRTWTSESDGRARVVAVEGGAAQALSALGAGGRDGHRVSNADALAWMAWAGASGGAHGRRAGMAAGRSKAWWAAASVAGALDAWPDAGELAGRLERIEWWTWAPEDRSAGWSLRLVAVDVDEEMAFGVEAVDSATPTSSAPAPPPEAQQ